MKLDGGSWQASGATVPVSVGPHTVLFKNVAGWTTPASQTVNISNGGAPTLTRRLPAASTSVVSSLNPSKFDASVQFTATVTSSGGTPAGAVTFKDGSTTLGTGTLSSRGKATFTTSALSAGSHSITAVYGGSTNFIGSTSATLTQTVERGPFDTSPPP